MKRHLSRQLVSVLALLSAGSLLSAPLPAAAAAPERLGLTYLAYLDEARILRVDIDLDLPAGGASGDRYRLSVAASTIGVIGGLLPLRLNAGAHGRAGASGVRPERYDASTIFGQNRQAVALTYRQNGSVVIASDPPTMEARHADAVRLADRTLDPVSATVALVDRVARRGACGGRLPVFDGARRYDLVVSAAGEGQVAPHGVALYSGPALRCSVAIELIDGFSERDVRGGVYPQVTDLWLAPVLDGVPALPVRLLGHSTLGTMRLDLIGARRVPVIH
jgi:hypothetical protein